MQLSGASGEGIQNDLLFLLGGSVPGYTNNDQLRNINRWYQKSFAVIMDAVAEWGFQENTATATLSATIQRYPAPTDILEIKRVEVLYDSSSAMSGWVVAQPIERHQISSAVVLSADINGAFIPGVPYYNILDNSFSGFIDLYPVPYSAVTGGLKFTYTNKLTYLSASADVPAFADPFHRILSLGGAYDWAITRHMEIAPSLKVELDALMAQLANHYGRRQKDRVHELLRDRGIDSEYS